nr:origin recognition complex subunit 6 [Onthophagus taurus]
MDSVNARLISTLAHKLGLDEQTTTKGQEYLRVYQNKSSSLRLNIPDSTKAVICLDLASKLSGVAFDQQVALQLSGLKQRVYSAHLNTIEKFLDLDKPVTISEVCVQLSCTELKDFSENILEKYKDNFPHADISHPQYVAIAIWSASKTKNVKISKQSVIGISRLKMGQFKELEQKFNTFLAQTKIAGGERVKKQAEKGLVQSIENFAKNKENELKSKGSGDKDEEIEEDYEVWKERILKEAYKQLKNKND